MCQKIKSFSILIVALFLAGTTVTSTVYASAHEKTNVHVTIQSSGRDSQEETETSESNVNSDADNDKKKSIQLPQTGENLSYVYFVVGGILIIVMIIILKKRKSDKRYKDENL